MSVSRPDFENQTTVVEISEHRPEHEDGGSPEPPTERELGYMAVALEEARLAFARDEVPIGACLVLGNEVVARDHNRTRERNDPLAHAELLVLTRVIAERSLARLPTGAELYCTVEPCFMCAGALLHARVDRVIWGVRDPKFGGCASLGCVLSDRRANHRAIQREGVLASEARELLQSFFRSKR